MNLLFLRHLRTPTGLRLQRGGKCDEEEVHPEELATQSYRQRYTGAARAERCCCFCAG